MANLRNKCWVKESSSKMLHRKDTFSWNLKTIKTKQYCLGIYPCGKNICKENIDIIDINQDISFSEKEVWEKMVRIFKVSAIF